MTAQPAPDGTRTLTVRLPANEARRLEIIARTEGISVNETIRRAVADMIETRLADDAFTARCRAQLAQDAQLLEANLPGSSR